MAKISIQCRNCKKGFLVFSYRKDSAKVCGRDCKKPEIILNCETCKKDFSVWYFRKDKARFCSLSCRRHDEDTLKRILLSNSDRKWNNEQREKFSNSMKGRRPKNLDTLLAIDRNGEKNPMLKRPKELHWSWKGGITKLNSLIRRCFKYRNWRLDIFKRDDWTCKICSNKGGALNADHYPKLFSEITKEYNIKSLNEAFNCEELWDINNGRTLCVDCHIKFGRRSSYELA